MLVLRGGKTVKLLSLYTPIGPMYGIFDKYLVTFTIKINHLCM